MACEKIRGPEQQQRSVPRFKDTILITALRFRHFPYFSKPTSNTVGLFAFSEWLQIRSASLAELIAGQGGIGVRRSLA